MIDRLRTLTTSLAVKPDLSDVRASVTFALAADAISASFAFVATSAALSLRAPNDTPVPPTFALKAGALVRRGRLLIVSPALRPFSPLSGRNSTYPAVQIRQTTSLSISPILLDWNEES
jgi:hypothetical protein